MQIKAISGWHDPRIRAKKAASLSDFEMWFSGRRNRYNLKITAQQIRRAVIMRKQGETWKDCGLAVGSTGNTLKQIIEFLPLELQP